jgi:omega-hydroxy-beta-dihydromenaquinone-9 sulfotransferase
MNSSMELDSLPLGKKEPGYAILQFGLGRSNLPTILSLLLQNSNVIRTHPTRVFLNLLLSLSLTPLRLFERFRCHAAVRNTPISTPPLFILGHHRSGTTHLFNLLSLNRDLAFLNSVQAALPELFLTLEPLITRYFSLLSSGRRPCDNITFTASSPQEDEFALTHLTPHSFLHVLSFPQQHRDYLHKYTLRDTVTSADLPNWTSTYLTLLKKLTLRYGGKRLLIKNAEHTARLPHILSLFPHAHFVNIVRDPYYVYCSSLNLYHSMLRYTSLQTYTDDDVKTLVLTRYRLVMKRYIQTRHLIPTGHLVEIRYEDLATTPSDTIRFIYQTLGLSIHEPYLTALTSYLRTHHAYENNSYNLSAQDVQDVNREWGFAFKFWNYPMLDSACGQFSLKRTGYAPYTGGNATAMPAASDTAPQLQTYPAVSWR